MPGPLRHSPSDILRWCLITKGLGSIPPATPWPIHIGKEPEAPDNLVTIYDIRGRDHGRTNIDRERQEHEGLQIRVRSVRYKPGFRKAHQIAIALDRDILHEIVTIDEIYLYKIHAVTRVTNVVFAGEVKKDEDLRLIFTINALISVRGESDDQVFVDPTEEDEFDDFLAVPRWDPLGFPPGYSGDYRFGEGTGSDLDSEETEE